MSELRGNNTHPSYGTDFGGGLCIHVIANEMLPILSQPETCIRARLVPEMFALFIGCS